MHLSENKYAYPVPLSGSLALLAFDTFLTCRSHRYHRAFQALQATPFLLRCSKIRKPLGIGAVERLSKRHLSKPLTSEEVCVWMIPLIPLYAPRLLRPSVPEDAAGPFGPWWHRLAPMGFEELLTSEKAWFTSYPPAPLKALVLENHYHSRMALVSRNAALCDTFGFHSSSSPPKGSCLAVLTSHVVAARRDMHQLGCFGIDFFASGVLGIF